MMSPAAPYRDWTIAGSDGQPLYGNAHFPSDQPRGVIILCHGFKGYKDYGFFPQLADAAARRGLIAHRFNFSHSGMTPRIDTFERPDLFERDTWGRQVEDLSAVIGAIGKGELAGQGLPVILFGASRGGVTALLTAAAIPKSIAGVVTAAAPHRACNLDDEQRAMLRRVGRIASPSSRTGQMLYVGREWLEEIEQDPERFDPLRAIANVRCPVLVVHGSEDSTVDVQSARKLAEAGGERARVEIIAGASHTFNAPNPLGLEDAPPSATKRMMDLTVDFALWCAAAPSDS